MIDELVLIVMLPIPVINQFILRSGQADAIFSIESALKPVFLAIAPRDKPADSSKAVCPIPLIFKYSTNLSIVLIFLGFYCYLSVYLCRNQVADDFD